MLQNSWYAWMLVLGLGKDFICYISTYLFCAYVPRYLNAQNTECSPPSLIMFTFDTWTQLMHVKNFRYRRTTSHIGLFGAYTARHHL